MSKKKPGKKTVVVTRKGNKKKERLRPTTSRGRSSQKTVEKVPLLFTWSNYKFILIGIACIALGMILMTGGRMPSPDVWDEGLIYSFRRTVIAPFLIIAGYLVIVYALFRKN